MPERTNTLVVLLAICLWLPLAALAQQTKYVVESYHAGYAWDASYKKALQDSLGAGYKFEFFEMDTKRLPKEQHQKMSDLAWQRYLALKPDLVVLGDDAALRYLVQRLSETKTPVVYLGINNNPRDYVPATAANFTGVFERPLLKRSLAFLQAIIPTVKRVLILFDDDITAQVTRKEIFGDRDSMIINDVMVEIRMIGRLASYREAVLSSGNQYDAIVVGLYQSVRTSSGASVDAEELIKWVSENSPVPLFAFWDFAVGMNRTAGGFVLQGKDMGNQAAVLVKRILENGTPPYEVIPVVNNRGTFLFSRSQLEKWKLTLPKGIASAAVIID